MDAQDRLSLLSAAAQFDVCGYNGVRARVAADTPLRFIHKVALPNGSTACLFKVLLTNVCTNDCAYCVNQVSRDIPRSSFRPEELAKTFMEMYSRRLVHGLFLSSAIAGNPTRTMDGMIQTAEILRRRYDFKDYIHLKILPGASFGCVEEACKLANRVSVNIEAPTAHHLGKLSARKDLYQGIIEPMRWVKKLTDADQRLAPSGQTTQFVVGAAGETDHDIISTTEALYREIGLRRAYFSAFQPVSRSRLEHAPATPPIREHRLYQVDWLFRVYGFSPSEVKLALGKSGNLSLTKDPKLAIARGQPWLFPVDVNKANYHELLRVPGIGPVSAQRIVDTRRDHSIFALEQLRKMGVVVRRANQFIWFQGMLPHEKQLSFLPLVEEEIKEPSLAGAVR